MTESMPPRMCVYFPWSRTSTSTSASQRLSAHRTPTKHKTSYARAEMAAHLSNERVADCLDESYEVIRPGPGIYPIGTFACPASNGSGALPKPLTIEIIVTPPDRKFAPVLDEEGLPVVVHRNSLDPVGLANRPGPAKKDSNMLHPGPRCLVRQERDLREHELAVKLKVRQRNKLRPSLKSRPLDTVSGKTYDSAPWVSKLPCASSSCSALAVSTGSTAVETSESGGNDSNSEAKSRRTRRPTVVDSDKEIRDTVRKIFEQAGRFGTENLPSFAVAEEYAFVEVGAETEAEVQQPAETPIVQTALCRSGAIRRSSRTSLTASSRDPVWWSGPQHFVELRKYMPSSNSNCDSSADGLADLCIMD
jgi:hypothetical protein